MEKIDLSLKDEIECMVQELQEAESHCIKSYVGTKDDKFIKTLNKIRELRTKWAEKIFVEQEKTQVWCLNKHLTSASKRATEVGTKLLSLDNEKECKEAFLDSGEILGMYYYLNEEKNNSPEQSIKRSFWDRFK
jgi:hypothetical protein